MGGLRFENYKDHEILTASDCRKILKAALENEEIFELLDYTLKPASDSIGLLGEYYHLDLEYITYQMKVRQKMRVFVKTLPYKNVEINKFLKEFGVMNKEALLYVNLLNDLQKFSTNAWCAKCYMGREDLIALEDVVDKGFQTFKDQSKFFTETQIKSMLNGLATLHASSIAYEVSNKVNIGDKFENVLFELSFKPKNQWLEVGKATVIELAKRHPSFQTPKIQDYIKNRLSKYLVNIFEIVQTSQKYRNVLCHRDLWAGNMLFKNENESNRVIFVDFQLCRYSPPAIDVLMALYLGLHPKVRKQKMKQYCLHYYKQFEKALEEQQIEVEEHLTLKHFQQSLEDFTLFGAFYNCICATLLRLPKNVASKMKQENPKEFDEFLNVERIKIILGLMQEHPDYCEYINECIEDLMEFIISKEFGE